MQQYGMIVLLLLGVTGGIIEGQVCEMERKCNCSKKYGKYVFLCPPVSPKLTLLATRHELSIYCTSLVEYDLTIFPDTKGTEVDVVNMRNCPLPKSFRSILETLNVTQINTLYLESISDHLKFGFSKATFNGLGSLETLHIRRFGDAEVEEGAFENLPNLKELYLTEGELSHISDIFTNHTKLNILWISRNKISQVSDGAFSNLSDLNQLSLPNNQLTKITKNYFTGLKSLDQLDLSSNNISSIDNDSFSELNSITFINLDSNNLQTLSEDIFKSNTKLRRLRMNYNTKLMLPDFLLSNLSLLETVGIEGCNLNEIPANILKDSDNLKHLLLSGNNLSTLPENLLQSKNKLENLGLNNNKLVDLPDNIFTSLENLEELHLDNNLITSINEKLLAPLTKLERLNLQRNKISTIDLHAFDSQINLVYLFLADNLYNMSYDTEGVSPFDNLDKLEVIDLRNNMVKKYPVGLGSHLNLKILYLRNNTIQFIKASWLAKDTPERREIDLSYNNISGIAFDENTVLVSENLRRYALPNSVDLSYNPFTLGCRTLKLSQYVGAELKPVSLWVSDENPRNYRP